MFDSRQSVPVAALPSNYNPSLGFPPAPPTVLPNSGYAFQNRFLLLGVLSDSLVLVDNVIIMVGLC